jgi:adenosylhomocysteine nucleosidase
LASGDAKVTGVVAALRAEARCASVAVDRSASARGGAMLRVRHSGIGGARAARAAQELLRGGADALLCFGVGGALDAELRSGDIVVATEIICRTPHELSPRLSSAVGRSLEGDGLACGRRLPTTIGWRRQLEQSLAHVGRVRVGAVLTSHELVCRAQDKQQLFAESGALVVDMESAAVASVAQAHAVPFMTVRVVADAATEELPPALQRALAPGVGARAEGVLSLLGAPGSWRQLAQLASRYRAAQAVLIGCARAGVACESLSPMVATA